MKRAILCILAMVCLSAGTALAQSAGELIAEADRFAAQFEHKEALEKYEAALSEDTGSYEAAWKASRELAAIGNNMESVAEKDEIEAAYARSVEMAERALEIDPEGVDAHFAVAVAKGRLGLYKGKKEMIELSKDVKKHGDIVLEKAPEHYKAHYLMARWHDKIANVNWFLRQVAKVVFGGLPPASNEKALEHYRRAVEINPKYVEAHKELGRFYMDRDEYEQAVEVLETCVTLPETEEHDKKFKEEARTLLEEARKKVG